MSTGTRSAVTASEDESLAAAIEQTRARVKMLEGKLASRRAAEAAELELMQGQLAELLRRAELAKQATSTSKARAETLRAEEHSLRQGLTRMERGWVKIIEPVLAATALFFCLLITGFSFPGQLKMIGLELLGLATGVLLALAWRMRRRRR